VLLRCSIRSGLPAARVGQTQRRRGRGRVRSRAHFHVFRTHQPTRVASLPSFRLLLCGMRVLASSLLLALLCSALLSCSSQRPASKGQLDRDRREGQQAKGSRRRRREGKRENRANEEGDSPVPFALPAARVVTLLLSVSAAPPPRRRGALQEHSREGNKGAQLHNQTDTQKAAEGKEGCVDGSLNLLVCSRVCSLPPPCRCCPCGPSHSAQLPPVCPFQACVTSHKQLQSKQNT